MLLRERVVCVGDRGRCDSQLHAMVSAAAAAAALQGLGTTRAVPLNAELSSSISIPRLIQITLSATK